MHCSSLKILTITATAQPDNVIDTKRTFDNLPSNHEMFDAVSIFCPNDDCVKTKFAYRNDVEITSKPKRFPPQQMSIDVSTDHHNGLKASIFRSGQVLIVGARNPDEVQRAIDAVSYITQVNIRSFEYRMINAGFRIKDILVNCAAACRCWNTHFGEYGVARYDGQRHAAVHVKVNFQNVHVTVMVFRTGTVQMFAARRMEDLEACQKMIVYFLSEYPTTFSRPSQISAPSISKQTLQKPTLRAANATR